MNGAEQEKIDLKVSSAVVPFKKGSQAVEKYLLSPSWTFLLSNVPTTAGDDQMMKSFIRDSSQGDP